jgi:uncharacterized membrane protein
MKRSLFKHIGIHVFRGLLAIIPLGLCYLVVRFFYLAIDARITGRIEGWIGYRIPGLGFLLVLISLYLLGLLASHWAGRRAFGLIEWVSGRIPLVKTIYTLGKQLADALSLPEKQAFKHVVMVEHFRPGVWSIGFVTATIPDPEEEGRRLLRLFIPTAPNPTSGFVVTVKESQVKKLDWSVPEAMNLILSGGMVGPDKA